MRRMVILSMFLALSLSLTLVGGARAAAFPPKYICFLTGTYGDKAALYMKSLGSISTPSGTEKFYTINGEYILWDADNNVAWASIPVTGTGHVDPATGHLHYSVNGAFADTTLDIYNVGIEGYLNSSLSGSISVYLSGIAYGIGGWVDTYAPHSCGSIPYSAKSGPKKSLAAELKARTEAFKAQSQPPQ